MKKFKMSILMAVLCLITVPVAYTQHNTGFPGKNGDNPFGIAWGFSYGYDKKPEIFFPQLRKRGIHLTKIYWFWQQIEPEQGKFEWKDVDAFLKQLTPSDDALFAVWSSSTWATKISSLTLPSSTAKSDQDYYNFIFQLVKHCEGRIKYWQNDCEPNNPVYWNGTADEFINQLKVFHKAVKDADPNATVVAGGYDGLFNPPGMGEIPGQEYGLAFFDKVIKEASAYFDVFDLRLYADPYTIPARVDYFRQKLNASGKPIICTEYNGPGFFGFPVNFKYIGQVMAWNSAVAKRDTAAFLKAKNPIASMYDSINTLAPETQMFLIGCSKELNDRYYQLQCIDIVMRNLLMLSAGVQKTMYWDLWHDTQDKNNLMTLMFAKNKVMDYENEKLSKEYPQAEVFRRMTVILKGIRQVKRIEMPGQKNLYLFEILRSGKKSIYAAWEMREGFTVKDQPPVTYLIPYSQKKVNAMDIFGNRITAKTNMGELEIGISNTPVFFGEEI